MDKMNVLVTGVGGGGHGEQILKALKMSSLDLNIYGADMNIISKGLTQVDKSFILPPANADNYIDELIKVCKENDINILFHGSEPELLQMNANRERIKEAGVFLPINTSEVLRICMDKYLTIDFLKKHNFSFPLSYRITSMDDIEQINTFPLVLKPSIGGGGSANTMIVQSKEELFVFSKYLFNSYDEFIAQEYVGTPDSEYTVGVLSDMNGEIINSIAVKRMILTSLGNRSKVKNMTGREELGSMLAVSSGISQGEIGKYPEVTKQCEEMAKALGSKGPLNIQCRLVDGVVYVFEINPRYSGTSSMRAMVGFNEPELMIKYHYLNQPIERNFDIPQGFMLRGLEEVFIPNDK